MENLAAGLIDAVRRSGSRPGAFEDGADDLLVPPALGELVLTEMGFGLHADALHHPSGGLIVRVAAREDAMRTGTGESHCEERPSCLGGISMPLIVRVKDLADLDLSRLRAPQDQRRFAHHRAVGPTLHREEYLIPFVGEVIVTDTGLDSLGKRPRGSSDRHRGSASHPLANGRRIPLQRRPG
jgi:hypothetical protein